MSDKAIATLMDTLAYQADQMRDLQQRIDGLPEQYIPKEHLLGYMDDLDALKENMEELQADMETVRKAVKDAVKDAGQTVERNGIQAVYVSGRTKWDTKKLDKAVEFHPWLGDLKTTGNPYVQLKGV